MKSETQASRPLSIVQSAFAQMADNPVPIDIRQISGLPHQVESWRQLRAQLLEPALPISTVDAVWVSLVLRAREGGDHGALVCAAMALPMLVRVTASLCPKWRSRHEIESEILCGFLAALPWVDLDRPYVLYRLRWATFRRGYAAVQQQNTAPMPCAPLSLDHDEGGLPVGRASNGHPELVLAEAVADGAISAKAAKLIALTRLERRQLTTVASELGQSYKALEQVRRRGEHKLAAWLANRAVEFDPATTSTVEAEALRAVSLSDSTLSADSHRRKTGRGQALKTAASTGVKRCGRKKAPLAQPASVEVYRRCS